MGIKVRCPAGHAFNAEERSRGRFARCPTCSRAVLVPGVASGPSDPLGRSGEQRGGLAARFKADKVRDPPESKPAAPPLLKQRLKAEQDPKTNPSPTETPAKDQVSQAQNLPPTAPQTTSRGGMKRRENIRWVGYQAEGTWKRKVYVLAIQWMLLAMFQVVPAAPALDLRRWRLGSDRGRAGRLANRLCLLDVAGA